MTLLGYFGKTPPPRFTNQTLHSIYFSLKSALLGAIGTKVLMTPTLLNENLSLTRTSDLKKIQFWHMECRSFTSKTLLSILL